MEKNNLYTVKDIAGIIENSVPAGLQESWDNSGLQIGFENQPVAKVLTCLELNRAVFEEAVSLEADMIVTHHPLIFGKLSSVCDSEYQGSLIMDLIKAGISVYSCHTPFDKVKGGNNDIIAELLELNGVRNLNGQPLDTPAVMAEKKDEADIGRIGTFKEPMSLRKAVHLTAQQLELSIRQLRVAGNLDAEIKTVGICTGAGADLMEMAAAAGCELFVTGDVKYHQAQRALELGMCIIDAGHYGTEKFFAQEMNDLLDKTAGGKAEIIASSVNIDPFEII